MTCYRRVFKRMLDISLVVLTAWLVAPLLLILAIVVKLKLGGDVFFGQLRPGLHGRPFRVLKFRSMTQERGPDGELLPDAQRLTPFGRWLRSTSFDELPELWNVVKGDMSLVGPRPLLMEYLPLYTPVQSRRHEVRPGITGLAQVSGRNAISWEERFALDVWYVENCSLLLDLGILWRTVGKVMRREGVSACGEATMPRFCGSAAAQRKSAP